MEPVDLDRVNFRQRRHLPPSVTEQGTPFWRIVGAVLTALLLFGVIQAVIAYAMYRHALSEAERILSTLKPPQVVLSQPGLAQTQPSAIANPTKRTSPHQWPGISGPVEARRRGEARACINGRVSIRLSSGWDQTSARCRAVSE